MPPPFITKTINSHRTKKSYL